MRATSTLCPGVRSRDGRFLSDQFSCWRPPFCSGVHVGGLLSVQVSMWKIFFLCRYLCGRSPYCASVRVGDLLSGQVYVREISFQCRCTFWRSTLTTTAGCTAGPLRVEDLFCAGVHVEDFLSVQVIVTT